MRDGKNAPEKQAFRVGKYGVGAILHNVDFGMALKRENTKFM